MNKGFLSWMRSNDKYIINQLEQQAQLVVDATAYLTKIAETSDTDKMKSYQSQITEIEEGGDKLVRQVFTDVDETFVTPLDREDISRLSSLLEKMLNNTKKAADRFIIFNVGRTPPDMIEHVNILNDASKEIPPLVSQLRNLKDYRAIFVNVDKIHKCENQATALYERAVTALFKTDNAIEIMKSKEIYDYIERAMNRSVDFSDQMQDMALKYG